MYGYYEFALDLFHILWHQTVLGFMGKPRTTVGKAGKWMVVAVHINKLVQLHEE
jgi:hypothetical protein